MKPPRDYQALRDEHANVPARSQSQQDQAQVPRQPEVDNAQSEPEPSRPNQVRAPSPGWTDSPQMDKQQAAAINYNNWANANVAERRGAQANLAANTPEHDATLDKAEEKLTSKGRLAADLQAAREVGAQKGPDRDASTPEVPQQERLSGKALLAEDLKAAKENANETNQSHDPGRSR